MLELEVLLSCLMRELFGLSRSSAKYVLDLISGFAQKMSLFHRNSGLCLTANLSFLLVGLRTYEFADFGFDASNPFKSIGFKHVEHPGLCERDQGQATERGEANIQRKPLEIYSLDHRRPENTSRTFYCDICWEPFKHQGSNKPYDGNFINKTWNTDEDKKNPNFRSILRTEIFQRWRDGVYDLTWHCKWCHAELLGESDNMEWVEDQMKLRQFAKEREDHKRKRAEKGYCTNYPRRRW